MYSIAEYGAMIRDRARLSAYAQALERHVTGASVVADIGAGTGIFTVLACRMGARRVYAIEPGDAFAVLKEIVAENGCHERVEFFPALSTEITLPERADVVISDLRGALPFYDHNLAAIIDARARHLAPGGTLIAARDMLRVAVASAAETHGRVMGPWIERERASFDAARRYLANTFQTPRADDVQLLSAAATWCEVDYHSVNDTRGSGSARLKVETPGTGHGLLLWFDCETAPGCRFSNAPGANPDSIYSQRLLWWPEPVALAAGETVEAEIHADPVGEDYIWRWNTVVRDAAGQPRREFRQSTFFGSPIPAETLPLRAAEHRPQLNEEGAVEGFILERMDGKRSLQAIAEELRARFPERFRDPRMALNRVAETSVRYARRNGR